MYAIRSYYVIRVACIGNSITAGARLDKISPEERYPTILQNLLGSDYTVQNLGVGGATLLKGSSNPYWNLPAYSTALAFKPDIIVVKLGTNDSNPSNWTLKANFVTAQDLGPAQGNFVGFVAPQGVHACLLAGLVLVVQSLARERSCTGASFV